MLGNSHDTALANQLGMKIATDPGITIENRIDLIHTHQDLRRPGQERHIRYVRF